MNFWNECPDDVLITIFKNFDLHTRMKASQTCKRWYELLKDPRARMEDVFVIELTKADREEYDANILIPLTHIGKSEKFHISANQDLTIRQQISAMINNGRLKIDDLKLYSSADFTMAECVNAILPSSISGLILSSFFYRNEQLILDIGWFQLPRLQRLTLYGLLIDPPVNSLPLLKYLEWAYYDDTDDEAKDHATEALILILPRFSTFEELRFGDDTRFVDVSFRNLLITINNHLPNLRRLYFESVGFHLSSVGSIMKEFSGSTVSANLKEIRFTFCKGEWIEVAQLFLRAYSLNIIDIASSYGSALEAEEIYRLTPLMKRKQTKLKLLIVFDHGIDMEDLAVPTELFSTLSNLRINGSKSSEFIHQFFGGGSYEKGNPIDQKMLIIRDYETYQLNKIFAL